MNATARPLIRALNLIDVTSIVVGIVIGTGVFLKSALMTQQLGKPSLVLLAWAAAGILSLAGVLTYAELGSMFPEAGGDYVYLREAFGKVTAFLYGWMMFAVAATGGIAAMGIAFAIFLSPWLPESQPWAEHTFHLFGGSFHWQVGLQQAIAIAAIGVLTALNCIGVVVGGRVQSVLTGAKVLAVVAIIGGIFLASNGASWSNLETAAGTGQSAGIQAFGVAMLAALWAYNGWNFLPAVAGEAQNARRNVPSGLIIGMTAVLVIYLLVNLSYFYALPASEVVTSNSTAYPKAPPVAAKAVSAFLGTAGTTFVSIAFAVSAFGALNGVILSAARIPYAMARDGLFFQQLANVSEKGRVPAWSIVIQGVWASVLALTGTFDQITTCTIFAAWIFYGVTVAGVFVLRRTKPSIERPIKTLGYPVMPLLFILVAVWLVLNTLFTSPVESGVGLLLIALGLPAYFYFRRKSRTIL
jgi:APA family basic amino acid/polyamine antiporter